MSSQRYPEEFKTEAVKQIRDHGGAQLQRQVLHHLQ